MSTSDNLPDRSGKNITRQDFEAVIRRAADLSLREGEAEDRLSEDEVVRIGAELGLAPHHVRQALYELPALQPEPSALANMYGPDMLTASRIIPGDASVALRRLEDYLTTAEYLRLVRRLEGRVIFQPAEDTISLLARGLLRPSNRFQIARARQVVLSVRPIEADRTHVQITTDMGDQRKKAMGTGVVAGGAVGLMIGALAGVGVLFSMEPSIAATAAMIATATAGTATGIWVGIRATASNFRNRLGAARLELDGLLDRAERGDRLEPPPAPWRRRLELKMLGRPPGNR